MIIASGGVKYWACCLFCRNRSGHYQARLPGLQSTAAHPCARLPDLLIIERYCGDAFVRSVAYRDSSAEVIARQGANARGLTKIPEAFDFFARLGHQFSVADQFQHEGREMVLDLNRECPHTMWR